MLYQHMHDERKRRVVFIIRERRSAACTNPQHYAVCVLRFYRTVYDHEYRL